MEKIRQAIERAKSRDGVGVDQASAPRPNVMAPGVGAGIAPKDNSNATPNYGPASQLREVELDSEYLRSQRIVTHAVTDPFSRPFDMLRTQILQSMNAAGGSKILAITSPTPNCGKTVTAVNLALSVARLPERSVMLVDLDFPKPRVATSLGLQDDPDVLSVIHGQTRLADAIVHARIGSQELMVLPTRSTSGSSELMASRAMAAMFQDLRRDYGSQIIIVDLPPILSSDDVIAILPQVDCALLVVAVGVTRVSEIEECTKHLHSTEVIRIVVNKVPNAGTNYFYY